MDQEIKQEFENLTQVVKNSFEEFEGKTTAKLDGLESRFDGLESRLAHVENQMITKDYLNEKLADLKGDLVISMRKGDGKLLRLVAMLRDKNVLDDVEVRELVTMEPFPKLAL